jgi:hypothetical protein
VVKGTHLPHSRVLCHAPGVSFHLVPHC